MEGETTTDLDNLKKLLNNMKKHPSSSYKACDSYLIAEHGIMKGLSIKFGKHNLEEARYWRGKAIEVDKYITIRKQMKLDELRNKVKDVERKMQVRRQALQVPKIDENHNHSETTQSSSLFKETDTSTERKFTQENTTEPLHTLSSRELDSVEEHTTSEMPQLMEQMKSLHELQERQEKLDIWYHDMQQQLELEKNRLSKRYEEMRLKNIREQQSIIDCSQSLIENSQDFLRTASMDINQSVSRINTPQKTPMETENQTSIVKSVNKLDLHKTYLEHISETEVEKSSILSHLNKSKTPTKPEENKIIATESYTSSDKLSFSNHNPASPVFFAQTIIGTSKNNTANTPLKQVDVSSLHQRCKEDTSGLHKKDTSLIENMPIATQTFQNNTPNIRFEHDDVFSSHHKDTASLIAKMVSGDNLEELKQRRKSRPIKFFHTPVSEEKIGIKTQGFDKDNRSSSTPHDVLVEKQTILDLSPVFNATDSSAQKKTLTQHYNEQMDEECRGEKKSNDLKRYEAGVLIVAVARGYLTRCLMNTYKVQEMVQTIKDTKKFLSDIDKENKKIFSTADRQLRTRLLDELSTKRKKLHDVFFNMKPREQMKLLAMSRLQKQEKEIHQMHSQKKSVKDGKSHSKKLSTASQRSIKRRQEHRVNNLHQVKKGLHKTLMSKISHENRPKTAPERVNLKKVEQEQKPLRPIQSTSSPTLSKRPTGNVLPSRDRTKKSSKKLNMNSVSTASSQRVMAAKLSQRYSSAV